MFGMFGMFGVLYVWYFEYVTFSNSCVLVVFSGMSGIVRYVLVFCVVGRFNLFGMF